jgi:hypothetical protein
VSYKKWTCLSNKTARQLDDCNVAILPNFFCPTKINNMPRNGDGSGDNGPIDGHEILHGTSGDVS